METVLAPASTQPQQHPGTLWRFSADDYHRMAELGILDAEARLELIDGYIHAMSPVNARHVLAVNRLEFLLARQLYQTDPPEAFLSIQNPIRLNDQSEPEPDVMVIWASSDPAQAPKPKDVALLVEVADSTLRTDRMVKAPRYAAAGIAELWIVNLEAQEIEVHLEPSHDGYRRKQTYSMDESIPLQAFPKFTIDVRRVLVA
ncbi:MAG: Uma2 family endonuclease [Rhodothermales bacterium]